METFPVTPSGAFARRRRLLSERVDRPVVLAAGLPRARNYRANRYPFRATSHFLYLVGRPLAGALLVLDGGKATLFTEPPDADDALWHGPRAPLEALGRALELDEVADLATAPARVRALRAPCALPPEDAATAAWLRELLGRPVAASTGDRLTDAGDAALADAMIALRLRHDEDALAQLRAAARVSARAHVAGMRRTRGAGTEAEILAAMLAELRAHRCADAYGPIVTVRGEVLHRETSDDAVAPGDLLLADVGGESPEGWASDITRTWPVSGAFSPTQRAIYDVVLAAQERAIELVRPGTRYRDVHLAAGRVIVEGLRSLGIFEGSVDGLLERNATAIFFPHGIGHLLGLDVHDMEDLGDRAGYAPGRARSQRFGERFLRLDRDLEPGMLVTIEPGFYQVPGILGDERFVGPVGADLRRDVLARFADVRGIRIEDDVLVTEGAPEVLTAGVPKAAAEVEALVRGG